jgi:hypothetical protein
MQGIFLIGAYLFVHYVFIGGNIALLIQNGGMIGMRICICYYFVTLISRKQEFVVHLMENLCVIFNLYAMLNIPVIMLQLMGHYELAARGMNLSSFMWEDMVSGLFGLYGTPYMATYFSFLIVYNYELLSKEHNIRIHRSLLKLFNICLLIFICIVSLYNDNKGFYIIFLSFILVYYLIKIIAKNEKRNILIKLLNIIKNIVPIVSILLVALFIAYKYTPFKKTVDMIERIIVNATSDRIIAGSSERIAMVLYALKNPEIRWLGAGLGKYGMKQSGALGFLHFGQSDLGAFWCLGGTLLVICIFVIMGMILRHVFNDNLIIAIEILLLLLLLIFTNVLTATSITVSYVLYVMTCWLCIRRISTKK